MKPVLLELLPSRFLLAFRFPEEPDNVLFSEARRPGSSPYFSTSCFMELYLVAALSFSIVSSRSLTSVLRCASAEDMRYEKYVDKAYRTP